MHFTKNYISKSLKMKQAKKGLSPTFDDKPLMLF